jgi:hypothetical protein
MCALYVPDPQRTIFSKLIQCNKVLEMYLHKFESALKQLETKTILGNG